MSLEAAGFIPALAQLGAAAHGIDGGAGGVRGDGPTFAAWMEAQVARTNDKLVEADRLVRGLALGETDNLHQVMMALEAARLEFQLVLQVRNRLLEAYQDVLRMQV